MAPTGGSSTMRGPYRRSSLRDPAGACTRRSLRPVSDPGRPRWSPVRGPALVVLHADVHDVRHDAVMSRHTDEDVIGTEQRSRGHVPVLPWHLIRVEPREPPRDRLADHRRRPGNVASAHDAAYEHRLQGLHYVSPRSRKWSVFPRRRRPRLSSDMSYDRCDETRVATGGVRVSSTLHGSGAPAGPPPARRPRAPRRATVSVRTVLPRHW